MDTKDLETKTLNPENQDIKTQDTTPLSFLRDSHIPYERLEEARAERIKRLASLTEAEMLETFKASSSRIADYMVVVGNECPYQFDPLKVPMDHINDMEKVLDRAIMCANDGDNDGFVKQLAIIVHIGCLAAIHTPVTDYLETR